MAGVELGTLNVKVGADAAPFARDMKQIEKRATSSARQIERAFDQAGRVDNFGPLREHIRRLSNEADGLSANFRAAGGDAREFARSMEMVRQRALGAAQGLDRTSDEYVELQRVAARAQGAIEAANRSMAGAGRGIGGAIGGQIASLAAGFTAAMVLERAAEAAVGFVSAGIEMNATLETASLQFETLMGSAGQAEAHVRSLFEFAKSSPFESAPIIEASRMLQTFGGAALNTEANLRIFGDAAAATSAPLEEVAFWVGRAYSMIQAGRPFGEAALRLQELAILSAPARAEMERLTEAGASADEVWKVFIEDMERFSGAMEKQQSTWQGLTSTLSDTVNLLAATATEGLFEALKGQIADLNAALGSEQVTTFAEKIGPSIAFAAAFIRKDFEGMKEAVASFNETAQETETRVEAANPELLKLAGAARQTGDEAEVTQEQIDALNKVIGDIGPESFASAEAMSALRQEIEDTGAAATEAGQRALAALGVLRRLRNERPELFDPEINQATPTEMRGVATGFGFRRLEEDVEAANKVVTESNKESLDQWWSDYQDTLKKIESGTKKTANESQKAFEQAYNKVKSAVQQALSLDVSVSDEDFLLERFGLRLPDPAEMGRRLADIAAKGEESPFIGMFEQLRGKVGDEAKALATAMLRDFQAGLLPELIDTSAAEALAERILVGEANMEQVANQITQSLINKGFDPARVQAAVGGALGGPLGAGMASAFTQGLQGFTATAAPQLQGTATEIVAPAVEAVTAATDGLGESVSTTLGGAVDQFSAEQAPGLAEEFGKIEDAIGDAQSAWEAFVKSLQGFRASIEVSVAAGPGAEATGFASGGDFIVPPGYPDDSFLMGVTSGERVTVTPASGEMRGGDTFHIAVTVPAPAGGGARAHGYAVAREVVREIKRRQG